MGDEASNNSRRTLGPSLDGFLTYRPRPSQPVHRQPSDQPRIAGRSVLPAGPAAAQRQSTSPPQQRLDPAKAEPVSLLHSTLPTNGPLLAATHQPVKTQHRKKPFTRRKKILLSASTAVLLIFFGTVGFIGFKALHTIDKVFHGNVISDARAAFTSTPLKGESSGRVNILLAGNSVDDPNHGGAALTDSILVLSIDTKNHSAFLLSVPRDLWVYIPSLGSYQKINAAIMGSQFNQPGYPTGGMGQLEQVIQTDLGIPIDYYGLLDYGGFKDAVNAVGGVTVDIQSPDPRGLYDPYTNLKLPNGPVTLDGQQALNLARARGDGPGSYGFPNSDFDRTAHQRQLFIAVAEKAKSLGVITNPLKISSLFNAFGNNFHTDLTLSNVLRLIQLVKGFNTANIQSYAFSSTLSSTSPNPVLTTYTDPVSHEEALIPTDGIGNYGQMRQYYQQLTSNNPVVKESPSVVILNASTVSGLAASQKSTLTQKGYNVAAIATAQNLHANTMIVDNVGSNKPASLKLLQQLYPGTTVSSATGSSEAQEAAGYNADFVVILGQNWDNYVPPSNSSSN